MILVKGSSQKGKSQSIKRLAKSLDFISVIVPWNGDDYDSYTIGTIRDDSGKEHVIGIENQGDPNSNQKEWIEACINEGSEVIVAASRSFGQTVQNARDLANDNGYELIEVSTHFHNGIPKLPNGVDLRDIFAENMMSLIMNCLK